MISKTTNLSLQLHLSSAKRSRGQWVAFHIPIYLHMCFDWFTKCLPLCCCYCLYIDAACLFVAEILMLIIPPASTKLKGGYTGFTLSVCLSVRLSVCGQNRVRSVSSKRLVRSISYLHILWSNFRRCVACNGCFKIWHFGEFFKFLTLTLSSFDLGSNMTQ